MYDISYVSNLTKRNNKELKLKLNIPWQGYKEFDLFLTVNWFKYLVTCATVSKICLELIL
jgi:hypothetical protein